MSKHFLGEFEELVMLAVMRLGKEAYGVKVSDLIEEATGRRVSTGALYTALSRLEEKGFISSWMGEATAERGGRAKKYFEITSTGKESLAASHRGRSKLASDLGFAFNLGGS